MNESVILSIYLWPLYLTTSFTRSDYVAQNVCGVPGGIVRKFTSRSEASQVFREQLEAGALIKVRVTHTRVQLSHDDRDKMHGLNGKPLDQLCMFEMFDCLLASEVDQDSSKFYAVYVGRRPGVFAQK